MPVRPYTKHVACYRGRDLNKRPATNGIVSDSSNMMSAWNVLVYKGNELSFGSYSRVDSVLGSDVAVGTKSDNWVRMNKRS